MSVGGYNCIYLAVYVPEIINSFGHEETSQKMKEVCGLGRRNYGGLRNVRPPIIDPLCCIFCIMHLMTLDIK